MSYKVTWKPTAEQELASIWIEATDRQVVTLAADRVDVVLRVDPNGQGESRPNGTRIMFELPLGIRFEVKDDDRLVEVLQVWRIK